MRTVAVLLIGLACLAAGCGPTTVRVEPARPVAPVAPSPVAPSPPWVTRELRVYVDVGPLRGRMFEDVAISVRSPGVQVRVRTGWTRAEAKRLGIGARPVLVLIDLDEFREVSRREGYLTRAEIEAWLAAQ